MKICEYTAAAHLYSWTYLYTRRYRTFIIHFFMYFPSHPIQSEPSSLSLSLFSVTINPKCFSLLNTPTQNQQTYIALFSEINTSIIIITVSFSDFDPICLLTVVLISIKLNSVAQVNRIHEYFLCFIKRNPYFHLSLSLSWQSKVPQATKYLIYIRSMLFMTSFLPFAKKYLVSLFITDTHANCVKNRQIIDVFVYWNICVWEIHIIM